MTTAQLQAGGLARYYRAVSDKTPAVAEQYDRYQASQPFSPCWQSLIGVRPPQDVSIPRALDTIAQRLGQMQTDMPMVDAQRDALSALMLGEEGDVIVVNGSPGSGKTTLLQSAVAVLFTQAALKKEPAPIVIGMSASEQLSNDFASRFNLAPELPLGHGVAPSAATDVYTELSRPGFTTRWLPAGNKIGFGLRMGVPDNPLLDTFLTEQRFIELAHGPGLHLTRRHFLRAFTVAFPALSGSPLTVAEVEEKLHEQLTIIHEQLKNIQAAAINIQGSFPDLLSDPFYQAKKARELAAAEALYNTFSASYQHWQKKSNESALWKTATSLFGSSRAKQGEVISAYIHELRGIPEDAILALEDASKLCIQEGDWKGFAAILQQESADALSRVRILEGQTEAIENLLKTWTEITLLLGGTPGKLSIVECDRLLDRTLRAQAFWLAVHIFEARWIDAMAQSAWSSTATGTAAENSSDAVRHKLHLYSMLTPCLVASLDRLPGHFLASGDDNQPVSLWNDIDLLIVDEANQIAPEYAGHFALAKRALVAGDIYQTLPAWAIAEADDHQLFERAQDSMPWDELQASGRAASSGSIMHMARSATPFVPYPDLGPGMYLWRHRRSVDSIIQFCNQLCYQGKLESLRPDSDVDHAALTLPAMGWAHVDGVTVATDQGMRNVPEAKSIAAWIHHNLDHLQTHYHLTIERVVAVVVPFVAQAAAIRTELLKLGIKDPVLVGTPHELSGINRPVVLFSSVYTWCDDPSYVFDQGPGFLNVAVSRATDSFLVFGDMGIYRADQDSPSGLLARHLFQSLDNSMDSDPAWAERLDLTAADAAAPVVLTTPEQHKLAVTQAYQKASSRVVIISPWCGHATALGEAIPMLAEAAIQRGIKCLVFIGLPLEFPIKSPPFQRYYKALIEAGATVELLNSVCSNLMFVDGREMFVGSEHWLSSPPEGQRPRTYATLHYRSPQVAVEIARVVKGLVARRQPATDTDPPDTDTD